MPTAIKIAFKPFKRISLEAFSVSLKTKIPIDTNMIMKALGKIQSAFPALSEVAYDEKDKIIKAKNTAPSVKDQLLFRADKMTDFGLSWGIDAEIKFAESVPMFFNILQEELQVNALNVGVIDFQVHSVTEWTGHHYKAIFQAYYSNSPLFNLLEADNILEDDIMLRSILDEFRSCVIRIGSDVKDSEVRFRKFEDDLMRITGAIGQIRGIQAKAKFGETFNTHYTVSSAFFVNKFIPFVIAPLDAAIEKLAGGFENG